MEECVKIAVAGSVDAGKSSLIGVLTTGELDDGRGSARRRILRTKHELESGRTSCISFNNIIHEDTKNRKVSILVDLAGHEKYMRTTMFGLIGLFVDYAIITVGANMGITRMTKEHLGVLLYLKIPVMVIITKVDIAPPEIYKNTKKVLKKLLKIPIFNKVPFFISQDESKAEMEMEKYLDHIGSGENTLVPILTISNKTGQNIEVLKSTLRQLAPREHWKKMENGSIMYIDSAFNVKGIGLVVSGSVRGEPILVNQKMWIGPVDGNFYSIRVRSMHNSTRQLVDVLVNGQVGCIAAKFLGKETLTKHQIKKGMMVFSDKKFKKNVTRYFKAKITILHHSTTITLNYQPVIHCGPIRQSAKIMEIENKSGNTEEEIVSKKKNIDPNKLLRTGDNAIITFCFMFHPEYIEEGNILFFRDGSTKGYGEIVEVIPEENTV